MDQHRICNRAAPDPGGPAENHMDQTMMVFGDAKKVVEDIVKALD